METCFIWATTPIISSFDPTYEAWKLANLSILFFSSLSFDPTYEAWKPYLGQVVI